MTDIYLYGDNDCHKSRLYQDVLKDRNLSYKFRDVAKDPDAARDLRALFTDGELKFPTLVIGDRVIRNPPLHELDRILARLGIYDPGIVHEPEKNRFVKYMLPQDAFVSYLNKGGQMTLTHIEVPIEKRGTGLGARMALKVFPLVREITPSATITCSFMRRVAASQPEWAEYFGIKPL